MFLCLSRQPNPVLNRATSQPVPFSQLPSFHYFLSSEPARLDGRLFSLFFQFFILVTLIWYFAIVSVFDIRFSDFCYLVLIRA
jgi:hypothetical protein